MKEIKKVLIATPLYPPAIGGPATYSYILDKELPHSTILDFGQVMKYPYIIRHIIYFFRCIRLARGKDIVLALDPLGVGLPAAIASKILRKKFIVKIVGDRAWETESQKKGDKVELLDEYSKNKFVFSPVVFIKWGQTLTARIADTIITPSKYLREIVSNWGIKKNKIKVIYNSFESLDVEESKETLRKALGLEGKIIISAGRLEKWKGFEKLIKIVGEMEGVRLLLVGDGPEYDHLNKIKNKKTKLLGRLSKEDLFKYIKASDLFILNTRYEGLSHQVLEVMSIGTPAAVSNVGGNPELIEDGVTGLLFEYNNTEDIEEVIREIFDNQDKAFIFAENAKKKASDFTQEKMLSDLNKIFS